MHTQSRANSCSPSRTLMRVVACAAAWMGSGVPAIAADAPHAAAESSAGAQQISDLGLSVAPRPVRERMGWKPPREILISPQMHDQLTELQRAAPQVKFVELSASTSARDIAQADAAIGICTPEVLQKARNLQWIQWLAAGVERCVHQDLVRERRPLITNMQRVLGASMAEHVMGMMLVLSRHLDFFFAEQQRSHWVTEPEGLPQMTDLEGKTILVVGLGGIGTEVAKRAHAFGMRVTATRASGRTAPEFVSYVGLPDELVKLAKEADYVVNCTPLTPQTTGIFNREFFLAMKPSAYFLSVGRGASTVTADLIEALRTRHLAGAGLDVTDPEPLPPDNALWRMSNVVITPHVSANTQVADELRLAVVRENLRRYIAGEPMLSVVDIERGY